MFQELYLLNDKELLKKVADKKRPQTSQGAFEIFYNRHVDVVKDQLNSLTHKPSLVDDLVQDVFLNVFEEATNYSEEEHAQKWLFSLCKKAKLTSYKPKKEFSAKTLEGKTYVCDPCEVVETKDLVVVVNNLTSALPSRDQELFKKKFYEGYSTSDLKNYFKTPKRAINVGLRLIANKLEPVVYKY